VAGATMLKSKLFRAKLVTHHVAKVAKVGTVSFQFTSWLTNRRKLRFGAQFPDRRRLAN
jgi:hypothetical protein